MKTLHLTRLERYVLAHPTSQLEDIARDLGERFGTVERACDRALAKTKAMTWAEIRKLLLDQDTKAK
jgi:hypothetical protein